MKTFKAFRQQLIEHVDDDKYVSFSGDILILGYGSVGQAILPLVLRHIDVNPKRITVLEKDNHKEIFDSRHKDSGITYVQKEVTQQNYADVLSKYVSSGGLIINVSLNIDAKSILEWCFKNDVHQIDTSLERWPHQQDETIPDLAERTLYYTHQKIREMAAKYNGAATCVVTHGANPGYVTHLTKRALLHLAKYRGEKIKTPTTRDEWAKLMQYLGVKVVHIAERDTQAVDKPKDLNEFCNTWSCEGFWAEGRAPAEMGWGTHEDDEPENGQTQGNAAYLQQPGVTVLMKSWVPKGGQYNGFCIQHSEAITISEYFTTKDGKFRPSVYYVYQPTDSAIASVHEMRGRELDLQEKQRILKDEIVKGIDELGVLLIGDTFVWWHGSQMSIDEARALIPGENATSVQVAGSLLGAIVWLIKNPNEGYVEPEAIPFEEVLAIGDKYWEPLASVGSNWTPNQDKNSLFYRPYDAKNPCSFSNFRVWT
jgi:homospermidine synthase